MRLIRAALAAGLIGLAAVAHAAPSATDLFRLGQYSAAAETGRVERTPAALATAARANFIRAAFLVTDRAQARALVLQGEADADAALRLDPTNYDALFQRASGLGYRATLVNSPGLAKQARTIMQALTRSEPARGDAWLGLGAWNGEALDQLGRMMAGIALGAKTGAMESAFAEAARRWPGNPVPLAYHGCLVLRLNADDRARAQTLLEAAVRARPREAYEATARTGAAEVLALLKAGDVRAARAHAKKLGTFGRLAG